VGTARRTHRRTTSAHAVGPRVRGRTLAAIAAAAFALALIWVGVSWWMREAAVARLPAPPESERLLPAVREHLRERYEAARAAPASGAAVGALCIAYHADMLFDHANRCYAIADDLDASAWHWTYYRAIIMADSGGGDALAATLREVVARAPSFGPAWLRLGDAEFKAGGYDAAEAAWRRASELPDPRLDAIPAGVQGPVPSAFPSHVPEIPLAAYASLGLARLALNRGDARTATQMLERLTMTSPGFGPAFRLLAESYRAEGREAEAVRAIYRAGRRPPFAPYSDPMVDVLARESRNTTYLLTLASESNLGINAAWSEHLTRRAAEFDPDNPDVIVKLGRILRTVGRDAEALPLFQRYHELVPGDHQGLAHIGSCLSALGRYDEAEKYFRQALAGRADPVTHYNLGLLMAVTGRLDQAVEQYEAALEQDPGHSDARMNLATVLARRGQSDRAVRELTRVLDADPENAAARANLGLVLLQQGHRERAARELEEALRLDPRLSQAAIALQALR
jgi:tetratricopeptide (TPR) repeat protein